MRLKEVQEFVLIRCLVTDDTGRTLTEVCPAQRPLGLGVCLACTEGRSCTTGDVLATCVRQCPRAEPHPGRGTRRHRCPRGAAAGGAFSVRAASLLHTFHPAKPKPCNSLFPSCPAPDTCYSAFCFYELDYSRDLIRA